MKRDWVLIGLSSSHRFSKDDGNFGSDGALLIASLFFSSTFTLKRVSLVSAEDGDRHLLALEARDAPFGAALVADLHNARFSSHIISHI